MADMQTRQLGRTDLQVSLICLGTMTFGEQNTEAEAHQQLDYALEHGVNFLDAAEMYPVPPRKETQGLTEAYIGSWLAARKNRDQVIVATKVAGPSGRLTYLRDGNLRMDRKNIEQALNDSLKRLQTDYIDLYQLHWPDRETNNFGTLGYVHDEKDQPIPLEETLSVLADAVQAGKIRYVGLSNETPWGVMRCLALAESAGLPRVVSIQNPYSLLNRSFEVGLAEIALREQVGLLAYSPLAMGMLTGKYYQGARPPGARMTVFHQFERYISKRAGEAADAYVLLAREFDLSPTQMALAYVNRQPFVTSNIIGATTLAQLAENIGSVAVQLPDELIQAIDQIHDVYTYPCP
jgi:aryl-alcohol dehydrogenase-like predicted oxidoreductase